MPFYQWCNSNRAPLHFTPLLSAPFHPHKNFGASLRSSPHKNLIELHSAPVNSKILKPYTAPVHPHENFGAPLQFKLIFWSTAPTRSRLKKNFGASLQLCLTSLQSHYQFWSSFPSSLLKNWKFCYRFVKLFGAPLRSGSGADLHH